MTTFAEALADIPYQPTDVQATGLLAPIVRACGHILYLVGAIAEPGYTLAEGEAIRELEHAEAHLTSTVATADHAPISNSAKTRVRAFCVAVQQARIEFNEWAEDDRGSNLKALADRAAALAAFFDLELAGVQQSDPGRTL